MRHELEVHRTPEAIAAAAAAFVAALAKAAVASKERFTFAVSGGHTPWAMFAALADKDVPWDKCELYQVDERVAPVGDADRNLTNLEAALGDTPATVRAMPVNDPDLEAAAARYGEALPDQFDLVHLGLGPDGHTASLVPGDPVLHVHDRLVALTEPYQGHRRMTLTYPGLARSQQLLWLVTGKDKRPALEKLLAGDASIPAGNVEAAHSLVMADRPAARG